MRLILLYGRVQYFSWVSMYSILRPSITSSYNETSYYRSTPGTEKHVDWYIKHRTGMRYLLDLKGFFCCCCFFPHCRERSPQEHLCQVHTENLSILRRSIKEITFCSLKHYSNISTFLSCFLIAVLREFSTGQCDEISSVGQRSAYPRTLCPVGLATCGCYGE